MVVETVSVKGATAVFGSPLPSGSLYAREEFIAANPNTVQALTNSLVRALRWLQTAKAEDVARAVPAEYLVGDRALYLAAFAKTRESYSGSGLFPAEGVAALHKVLVGFEPAVREATGLRLEETYTNAFVRNAPGKNP